MSNFYCIPDKYMLRKGVSPKKFLFKGVWTKRFDFVGIGFKRVGELISTV